MLARPKKSDPWGSLRGACPGRIRPALLVLTCAVIAVSLFVLGAFLSLASNLADVVARWSDKVQVTFYLEDQLPEAPRESLETPEALFEAVGWNQGDCCGQCLLEADNIFEMVFDTHPPTVNPRSVQFRNSGRA